LGLPVYHITPAEKIFKVKLEYTADSAGSQLYDQLISPGEIPRSMEDDPAIGSPNLNHGRHGPWAQGPHERLEE